MSLTNRDIELLEGMIEVQLDHARRCDTLRNIHMAEQQKARDIERVNLLRKIIKANEERI